MSITADIFLSYVREDRDRAANLADALSGLGWTVWWDRRIVPGRSYEDVIAEQLATARCVIVLWSRLSVKSDWVRDEAGEAKGRGTLVPTLIDDVTPPFGFRQYQNANLTRWHRETADPEFQLLLEGVSRLAPNASAETVAPEARGSRLPGSADRPTEPAWGAATNIAERHAQPEEPLRSASEGSGPELQHARTPPRLLRRPTLLQALVGLTLAMIIVGVLTSRRDVQPSSDAPASPDAATSTTTCDTGADAAVCQASCDAGRAEDCTQLGYRYETGNGVARDMVRAAGLYRRGCDGGNDVGCSNLAILYREGTGVERDDAGAVALFQKSCDQGHAPSCTDLGWMYDNGRGVSRDIQRAESLYGRGCDGGNYLGCNNLAILYRDGKGVKQDDARALGLYQKGCDGGHSPSCTDLGWMYEGGRGVSRDLRARRRSTSADATAGTMSDAATWRRYFGRGRVSRETTPARRRSRRRPATTVKRDRARISGGCIRTAAASPGISRAPRRSTIRAARAATLSAART